MYQSVQETGSLSQAIITRDGLCVHYSKQYIFVKINYLENVFLNVVKMNIFKNYYVSHYDDL